MDLLLLKQKLMLYHSILLLVLLMKERVLEHLFWSFTFSPHEFCLVEEKMEGNVDESFLELIIYHAYMIRTGMCLWVFPDLPSLSLDVIGIQNTYIYIYNYVL